MHRTSSELLAAVALCVTTTGADQERQGALAWTTLLPLACLCAVTFTAGWQRFFAADPKLGFLSHAQMIQARLAAGQLPPGAKTIADARHMLFNDRGTPRCW